MSEAERKVWMLPELVAKLFSELDPESVLNLARVVDKDVLKESLTSKVWQKIISDNCPYEDDDLEMEEKHVVMRNLAAILKLLKTPSDLLLDLLDVICERFPSNVVTLVCPRHPDSHHVSVGGFLLLEEVEKFLGTAELGIQSMEVNHLFEKHLNALASRISRQQDVVASVSIGFLIYLDTDDGAESFYTLLSSQAIQVNKVRKLALVLGESIGEKGWAALAKAIQTQPLLVDQVRCSRSTLAKGREEDVKKVWEAAGLECLEVWDEDGTKCLRVEKAHNGWERLDRIMGMSEAEFAAEVAEDVESESGHEEEESEDEDGDEDDGEEGDGEAGEEDEQI